MIKARALGFRFLAILVCGSLLLSSCASTGQQEPLTPAEERLKQRAEDSDRTMIEGMLVTTAAVTAFAALIAALLGKDPKRAALITVVPAAAAGYLAGRYYANMKEQYVNQEDRLDAMTARLREENATLQATLVEARTVVAEKKRLLADVSATAKKEKLSKADIERKLMSVDRNIALLEETIATRRELLKEFRRILDEERQNGQSEKLASLQQQIVSMEKTTALLQAEVDALSSRRASLTG